MTATVFYILIVVALANGIHGESSSEVKEKICEPGSQSKVDCNTCTCTADGTAMACTKRGCPPLPAEALNPDGSIKLPHQGNPLLRSTRRRREVPYECEPNKSFKQDCNHCICSPDGRSAACTLRGCLPLNFPGKIATPNATVE